MPFNHNIIQQVSNMTLAEKIGQLIQIGFDGTEPAAEIKDLIKEGRVGGIIIFGQNVQSPSQIAQLTSNLQALARQSPSSIPLFISIDQEGGSVARLVDGVTVFPGNMALGATGREDLAYEAGRVTARELAALGINLNFAPVIDVNNNPANPVIGIRSFGEDPGVVARMGRQMIRGLRDGGVLATAKHFPGHGDTAVDSHLGLPVLPHHTLERLYKIELRPFQTVIADGVASIMSAHVMLPELDPILPATLSPKILTGLLRNQLGFNGLIFTDCLEMQAIAARFGTASGAAMAVTAGADQLLISHILSNHSAAYQAINNGVEKGEIPLSRINEAVSRILTAKQFLNTLPRAEGFSEIGSVQHQSFAREIAKLSLTLIRNEHQLLPLKLKPEQAVLIISFHGSLSQVEEEYNLDDGLGKVCNTYHSHVCETKVPLSPSELNIQQIVQKVATVNPQFIIVATQDAWRNSGQTELVKQLFKAGYPLAVAALRTPYDLQCFPEIGTFVAAYGFRQTTLEALGELLWGKQLPYGKLPVNLPGLYPIGHGMSRF